MRGFIYGQTEYNLLASSNRLDDYIKAAKASGFDFLTITDSNLYANYKFYKECLNNNIKPIIGLEYTFVNDLNFESKVLLYALNNEGYKSLLKITSRVKTEGMNDLDSILNDQNLLYVYVFNDSYLEYLFYKRELQMLDFLVKNIANKNTYFGISYTNKLNKIVLNTDFEDYINNLGLNTLPIHKCLYMKNEDACIYEALRAIAGEKVKVEEFEDYAFDYSPSDDVRIDNFINRISLTLFTEQIKLPTFPNSKGVDSKTYLEALCYKGLERRGNFDDLYKSRLQYELDVIHKMGYDDYFLIVWDFIKFSKQNDILVGPGRGSAAGSLVAYCLGITEVDPIKYNLLFERFLNPWRISMPDIDTDFPDVKRDLVINHVKEIFGADHVCNISAYGTFRIKSSVRDLARVTGVDERRIEKIIDMIESLGYDRLLKEYEGTDMYSFLYTARGLEGLPKHISTHAAGIILSSLPLTDIIPLQEGINGLYQSQLEASDLEKIGLLKMDFLGIRNLTMIEGMMAEIPGFDLNALRNIPLDDPKVYSMLSNADTLGIFQLESQGMKNVLKKLKPTEFEDIVAVLALYRPGPMDHIDDYIERKHGKAYQIIHEDLRPILSPTYGIIIYQEQIMQIAQVFAGYSLGEADILRRAVSKKDSSILDKEKESFISRSVKHGYSEKVASDIYELIYKFANYGFNRSHSVAYALLSYQMCYFKVNYFNVFMANILNNVIGNSKLLYEYIRYAKRYGLHTYKPNINVSTNSFVSTSLGLFMPLNSIFSVGDTVTLQIIEERKKGLFESYDDFKRRVAPQSNVLQALIMAGALDIFGQTKKSMASNSTKEDEIFSRFLDNKIEDKTEYDFEYLKEMELKYLGMNLEYNIFKDIRGYVLKYKTTPIRSLYLNKDSRVIAAFKDLKVIKTKNGEQMLVGMVDDSDKELHIVMFPRDFSNVQFKINRDVLYLFTGRLKEDERHQYSLILSSISNIE